MLKAPLPLMAGCIGLDEEYIETAAATFVVRTKLGYEKCNMTRYGFTILLFPVEIVDVEHRGQCGFELQDQLATRRFGRGGGSGIFGRREMLKDG